MFVSAKHYPILTGALSFLSFGWPGQRRKIGKNTAYMCCYTNSTNEEEKKKKRKKFDKQIRQVKAALGVGLLKFYSGPPQVPSNPKVSRLVGSVGGRPS